MEATATLPARTTPSGEHVAVLPHEGTFAILYGTQPIPIGNGYRPGYLARPDEAGRFPVVVVIPGLSGIRPFVKDLCRRLARWGFSAVAPEVYESDGALGDYFARSDRAIISDFDETFEFIQSDDVFWSIPNRIGVLGLDVGGRFALTLAANRLWVGSTVVVSAPLTGDEDREFRVADLLGRMPVPILGLYGSGDELIAPETVDEAQNRAANGVWLLYDGARHDFLDDDSGQYDAGAASDAFARMVSFFQTTLPKPEVEDLG
jgi:carboxymethylenebutenolidase